MIVSIHQPGYLPWLGYFDKIAQADVHVYLDTVQFEKESFDNRNRIRTSDGWQWLTIPVLTKGLFKNNPLRNIRINPNVEWNRKHWASLEQNYRKAKAFGILAPKLREVYEGSWDSLYDLNLALIQIVLQALEIKTKIVSASDLQVIGTKSDLVLNICKGLGATTYLSGALGINYLNEKDFAAAGIAVRYQNFQSPEYQQVYPGFVPNLSAIDFLSNVGSEAPRVFLQNVAKFKAELQDTCVCNG